MPESFKLQATKSMEEVWETELKWCQSGRRNHQDATNMVPKFVESVKMVPRGVPKTILIGNKVPKCLVLVLFCLLLTPLGRFCVSFGTKSGAKGILESIILAPRCFIIFGKVVSERLSKKSVFVYVTLIEKYDVWGMPNPPRCFMYEHFCGFLKLLPNQTFHKSSMPKWLHESPKSKCYQIPLKIIKHLSQIDQNEPRKSWKIDPKSTKMNPGALQKWSWKQGGSRLPKKALNLFHKFEIFGATWPICGAIWDPAGRQGIPKSSILASRRAKMPKNEVQKEASEKVWFFAWV